LIIFANALRRLRRRLFMQKLSKNLKNSVLFCLLFFLAFSTTICAQFEFPPLSAKGKLIQIVGDTKVEIEYERPSVRKRKIFGELVPWNKIW
jgi:hypothetical protein